MRRSLPRLLAMAAPAWSLAFSAKIAGDIAGGPDDYDSSNALVEPAIGADPCLDMVAAHVGQGITDAQYEALAADAAGALNAVLGTPTEGRVAVIRDAVVNALIGQQICEDIIELDPVGGETAACYPAAFPNAN